jgi:hypothetical protein
MASFFSKLFDSNEGQVDATPTQGDPVEYGGLTIRAAPIADGGQWRLAGVLIKQSNEGSLQRNFVRADVLANKEEAEELSVCKGKQIIDEQGENLFADGAKTGRT